MAERRFKIFKSELSESYHKALKDKQQRIIEKTKEQLYKTAWGYQYEETNLDGQGNIQIVEVDKFQEKYNILRKFKAFCASCLSK